GDAGGIGGGGVNIYLDDDLRAIQAQTAEYVEREIVPKAGAWEQEGRVPREVLRHMGEVGFFGLRAPEDYGGIGMGPLASVVFAEQLGRSTFGGFTITVLAHTDLAMPYVSRFGSEELKQRYLGGMVAGEIIGGLAVTEPDAGSDVAAIRTTAHRDGDEYVIDG